MTAKPMRAAALVLDALVAGYGTQRVLDRIDLRVARGEWLAVVGANGCGKSTLLDTVAGRHRPDDGRIAIDGHDLATDDLAARARLGYAVAADELPPVLSGRQCLLIHAQAKGLPGPDAELLELAEAMHIQRRLDQPLSLYSYGTRQKLGVLLALLGDPALIVLDESFNGLDAASGLVLKRHLRARIDAGRCGVLLATHALDLVERWCDRCVLLHEGRIAGEWDRAALRALHADGGLEAAMGALPLA